MVVSRHNDLGLQRVSRETVRSSTQRTALSALVLGGLAVLAGCAQMQQPGYYNPQKPSSETDAIANAEATYTQQTIRAPSQIQLAIKRPVATSTAVVDPNQLSSNEANALNAGNASQVAPIGPSAQAQLIPIAQTFAGTLPCFHSEMKCTAQRITLTLAPNSRWRARAAYLEQSDQSGKPLVEQGCWRTYTQQYPNIVLMDMSGNVRAELVMTSNNVLTLKSINGLSPNLSYTITRQPDIDPIAELDKSAPPKCND